MFSVRSVVGKGPLRLRTMAAWPWLRSARPDFLPSRNWSTRVRALESAETNDCYQKALSFLLEFFWRGSGSVSQHRNFGSRCIPTPRNKMRLEKTVDSWAVSWDEFQRILVLLFSEVKQCSEGTALFETSRPLISRKSTTSQKISILKGFYNLYCLSHIVWTIRWRTGGLSGHSARREGMRIT